MRVDYVRTKAYGWEGILTRYNQERNNPRLPNKIRQRADNAHSKIVAQLADAKLMRLRESLIRAHRAKNTGAISQITQQMRAYQGQDLETGI